MGYETERDVVRGRVATWSSTAIDWSAFNGTPYNRSEGVAFLRPRVEDGETVTVGVGGTTRHRKFATLVLELFYPSGRGQETALQYVDSLITLFHKNATAAASGVHFWLRPSVAEAGADGNFFKTLVLCPYYREELA